VAVQPDPEHPAATMGQATLCICAACSFSAMSVSISSRWAAA
jgi:hypothetical protein